jgi:hypothetical protein
MFEIGDWDFWWHIRAGELVLETGSFPTTDTFTHTFAGAPWRYSEFGGQVIFAFVFRVGGAAGVVLFKSLVALAGFILLFRLVTRTRAPSFHRDITIPVVSVVLAALASVFRLTERPEIFMFVLFPATLLFLERIAERARRVDVAYLAALIALWSNLHRSALVGVALVALYAALSWIPRLNAHLQASRRHLSIALPLAFVALFANPSGLAILSTGGGLIAGLFGGELPYSEWKPPTVDFFLRDSPASALVVVSALIVAALRVRIVPRHALLLFVATTIAGLASARFVPLAAMSAAWVVSAGLSSLALPRFVPLLTLALLLIADVRLLTSRTPFPGARPVFLGLKEPWFPRGAADFLDATRPPGKLFHAFHFGGYLAWRLKGVYATFIDGRSDTVFPREFISAVGHSARDPSLFAELTRKHDATIALLSWSNRASDWSHIAATPDWRLAFWDDVSALYVRETDASREWLRRYAFRALTVANPPAQIGAANAETLELLRRDVDRNVAIAPNSARAHFVRGLVYRRLGNDAVARESEMAVKEILKSRGLE